MASDSINSRAYVRRRPKGSILLMLVIVVAVIVVIAGVGFVIYLLMFTQKRAQNQADSIALSAATLLNAGDREGQMNNLVARCRELVHTSRQNHDAAQANYRHLEPLANQLLEEARTNARLLEKERRRLLGVEQMEVKQAIEKGELESGKSLSLTLPGMTSYAPKIMQLDLGTIEGVQSNVEVSNGNPELTRLDLKAGYIEKESGLYKGNINAKLPGMDNDLDFKICSLAAPVKGYIAPARLVAPDVFKSLGMLINKGASAGGETDQLPSAIHVGTLMKVVAGGGGNKNDEGHQMEISSTAATGGGAPPP